MRLLLSVVAALVSVSTVALAQPASQPPTLPAPNKGFTLAVSPTEYELIVNGLVRGYCSNSVALISNESERVACEQASGLFSRLRSQASEQLKILPPAPPPAPAPK